MSPYQPTTIAVLSAGLEPAAVEARMKGLIAHWPGPRPPSILSLGLTNDGSLGEIAQSLESASAVIALGTAATRAVVLRRLPAIMDGLAAGAVAVIPDAADAEVPEPGHSIVLLDETCDDRAVAAAAHALASLHPTFRARLEEMALEQQVRAAAAEQFERQQSELQLAVLLQREFLPRTLPSLPGVEFGALFRPGSSVSGDLYDVVRLDEHHAGFLLADACGHGVPAALLMMLTSRLLPMKEIGPGGYRIVPPGEAITRLNDLFMERRGETNSLISAVYGVIDCRDGSIRLASAGHPPAVVATPTGVRVLGTGGPLIGACPGFEYPQQLVRLTPGETLVVFSDGFEHLASPPTINDHVHEVLTEPFRAGEGHVERGCTAAAVETLSRGLDVRSGSLHQADDITLLAIGRLREAAAVRAMAA